MTTPPLDEVEPRVPIWRRTWRVPIVSVLTAILIVVGGVAIGYRSLSDIRHDQRVQACENSNEFRQFFGDYLESEIGGENIADAPGFDDLSPEVQAFVLTLQPAATAGRAERQARALDYRLKFPIQDCDRL